MTPTPEQCGECGKPKCDWHYGPRKEMGLLACLATPEHPDNRQCHGHQAEKEDCKDCGGPTSAGVFTDSERICQASCTKPEEERNALQCAARGCEGCTVCAEPKPEEGGEGTAIELLTHLNERVYREFKKHGKTMDASTFAACIGAKMKECVEEHMQAALLRGREEGAKKGLCVALAHINASKTIKQVWEGINREIDQLDAATNSIDEKRG